MNRPGLPLHGAAKGEHWTPADIAILRERYPAGGTRACLPLLPTRSKQTIRQRAHQIGLRRLRADITKESRND